MCVDLLRAESTTHHVRSLLHITLAAMQLPDNFTQSPSGACSVYFRFQLYSFPPVTTPHCDLPATTPGGGGGFPSGEFEPWAAPPVHVLRSHQGGDAPVNAQFEVNGDADVALLSCQAGR